MRAILQRGNSPETAVRIGLGQSGPRPDKYRFALELSDCIVQNSNAELYECMCNRLVHFSEYCVHIGSTWSIIENTHP